MKKIHLNSVVMGLIDYEIEETEKLMAEAEKAAEINEAWNEYESAWKSQLNWEIKKAWQDYEDHLNFLREQSEMNENWISYEEEVRRTDRLAAAKDMSKNRRRAAAKAKLRCVEVAEIACRSYNKSADHDNHWSYKALSLTKSIRGNHDVFQSRTYKAEDLIKRAEKVTGGQFDWRKVF